eukprot:TRINITY_DN24035_c0_g1_i2.p3 TRINITY_DN24035_c0_g1~~TRINITY_DN24035_c0_g1_i2.p3  ORF type:complete len:108 (+),score=16.65 TRINITY_DN24035_c0_g1_i2:66-389(+)
MVVGLIRGRAKKTDRFAGKYNTILEALQNEIGVNNVKYVPGVSYVNDGKYFEDVEDQSVSYTHLRAHETRHDLVCRLLLEKKKNPKLYEKNNCIRYKTHTNNEYLKL